MKKLGAKQYILIFALLGGSQILPKSPVTSMDPELVDGALAAYIDVFDEDTPEFQKKSLEHWITVFVHGIMSVKYHINLQTFIDLCNDKVDNTIYAKTVEYMRKDPHFYKNQAMQGFGLKKIHPCQMCKGNPSAALAAAFNEVDLYSNKRKAQFNHHYTFGWSGLLSTTQRYKDSVVFYRQLYAEIQKFRDQGIEPKLRIIGYSHGGNICLNLASVRQHRTNLAKNFDIDQLVLIGMPVQQETDYLINDPIFKKVYNIFSHADRIQPLDFFSKNQFFSGRTFTRRKNFKLPKKLTQIRLKITRATESARTNPKKFKLSQNLKNPAIVSGRTHLLTNASPGHAELWFFGWTPLHYRDNFPLKPLPSAVMIPAIVKGVESVESELSPRRPIIVDVRPDHGFILVKNLKNKRFKKLVGSIPREKLDRIKKKVQAYAPANYTIEAYNKHVEAALEKATKFYRNHRATRQEEIRQRRLDRKRLRRQAHRQHKSLLKTAELLRPYQEPLTTTTLETDANIQ